jgi:hypothetical protein
MPNRKFTDLPRLSGRPEGAGAPEPRPEPTHVFRRFFNLLERLERPAAGPGQPPSRTPGPADRKPR